MDLRENAIGLYEKALPNRFSWEEKCLSAKLAGYDFIELSVDESDVRLARLEEIELLASTLNPLLKQYSLSIRSLCLSAHRRFPFGSADAAKRERAYDIMKKALHLADALHIRNIQLAGYDVYYEQSTDASKSYFLQGLKDAAKLAERHNIMLSLEVMDTPFMGTIERAVQYVELVNSPYLKVYPDLGNLSQFSDHPAQELIDHVSHIVAIHLKDTQKTVFKEVPFGKGTVDFKTLFKTLHSLHYQGPFLVEMWADNQANETLNDVVKRLRDAKSWLYERMISHA